MKLWKRIILLIDLGVLFFLSLVQYTREIIFIESTSSGMIFSLLFIFSIITSVVIVLLEENEKRNDSVSRSKRCGL